MTYLIPLQMAFDILPSRRLLEEYDLLEYAKISDALQRGEVSMLQDEINEKEIMFHKTGVMSVMTRLRLITIRNFIMRIQQAVACTPELQLNSNTKQTIIRLEMILKPLKA